MNLIVVGASYRSAPIRVLEGLSGVSGPETFTGTHVAEAVVLTTCNRTDVYAAVPAFHAGLARIGEILAQTAGLRPDELAGSLYVHHGAAAVRHVFRVAAGLESMVAGEPQILGQLRDAYQRASDVDSAGKVLHELMQQALRVGKRAHAETGIDKAPRSMVGTAIDLADASARRWLIVGAGAMGALAAAELSRRGITGVTMVNRGDRDGVRPLSDLPMLLTDADVVIAATASVEPVLSVDMIRTAIQARAAAAHDADTDTGVGEPALPGIASSGTALSGTALSGAALPGTALSGAALPGTALSGAALPGTALPRAGGGRQLTILDLALPRDVEAGVGALPGVRLIDIEHLSAVLPDHSFELDEVERIVAAELETYSGWLRGNEIVPTVAALRSRADDVVAAELARLNQRRPDLTEEQRGDVAHAVRRVVQRLLHEPTVRVRQLAAQPGGEAYAQMVRDLFDLDPQRSAVADFPEVIE